MSTHDLIATARFHGEVMQRRYPTGERVELGADGTFAIPLPAELGGLALLTWVDPITVRVTDANGQQHTLVPDEVLELTVGDLQVELELSPRVALRRTEPVSWRLSTGWLVVVLLFTIGTSWYDKVKDRRCQLFALTPELALALGCVQQQADNGVGADLVAEYLERLIKKDYAGEEDGVLTRGERPEGGKTAERYFLPAGNRGPTDTMGGADDTAPEALRVSRSEYLPEPDASKPAPRAELEQPELPEGIGTPVEPVELASDADGDGDDALAEADTPDDESVEQPAEEELGWGIQDWYDEAAQERDQFEIDFTRRLAEHRLKIDPNDPAALSLLSYYQYLDEDYEAAEKTYDRYIEILPDDAAGYNNKALVYKRLGQYKQEEALYRVALSLEPMDVTAMNNLGVNLAHQGRFDEALEVMRQLETLDPDDAYADLHRAKIHAEMGNDELALQYLRKSLQGMAQLDTLHHIEFRQDIRLDPSFAKLRETRAFRAILYEFYGDDTPVEE